jgi:hypothetical protein
MSEKAGTGAARLRLLRDGRGGRLHRSCGCLQLSCGGCRLLMHLRIWSEFLRVWPRSFAIWRADTRPYKVCISILILTEEAA